MRALRLGPSVALLLGAGVLTSCADSPTAATSAVPVPAAPNAVIVAPACQTINFNSFAHGALVNPVTVFGTPLTVTATAYTTPGGVVASTPRAYDSDNVGGDTDLEHSGPSARCPACAGLDILLVTQEPTRPIPEDAIEGGTLQFSGFGGLGPNLYIQSYTVVDHDLNEPAVRLFVDGVLVGASTAMGDGSVQTVTTTSQPTINSMITFTLGTPSIGDVTGSGAIDNIVVCRRLGGQGCTPGYWKQEHHFDSWQGYTPTQSLESVFDVPNILGMDNVQLAAALDGGGGSGVTGAARILMRAAVAALLNAASSGVDYPRTVAEVIADVNAALASLDRETMLELAGELDRDNNLGCPLN